MEKIQKYVESKGCEFISGEITTTKHIKIKIISTCGHESTIFYTNFRTKGTGILCNICVKNRITTNVIKFFEENTSQNIENDGIQMIQKLLIEKYDFQNTREGALADFILKPKLCNIDTWYGVQLKTTCKLNSFKQYAFSVGKTEYANCILLLNVLDEERIWYLPPDIKIPKSTINIGSTSASKYAKYEVLKENLVNHIQSILDKYIPHPKSYWNKSTICCDLEDHFIQLRKEKLPFLDYKEPRRNGLPHDFIVNNFKVQEKSISIENRKKKTISFTLQKNNGSVTTTKKTRKFKAYDIDDNDFYWLWLKESDLFYIIPQQILIEQNIIGPNGKGQFTIPKRGTLQWIQPYTFNINEIDQEKIKSFFKV